MWLNNKNKTMTQTNHRKAMTEEKVTAFLDDSGKLTGQFQKGDWSHHRDFDPRQYRVMTLSEFYKALEEHNEKVRRAWRKETIEDFLGKGFPNPHGFYADTPYADNFWN
jgi:hypothetical protein